MWFCYMEQGDLSPIMADLIGGLLDQSFSDLVDPQERAEDQQSETDDEKEAAFSLQIGLAKRTFDCFVTHVGRSTRSWKMFARLAAHERLSSSARLRG